MLAKFTHYTVVPAHLMVHPTSSALEWLCVVLCASPSYARETTVTFVIAFAVLGSFEAVKLIIAK